LSTDLSGEKAQVLPREIVLGRERRRDVQERTSAMHTLDQKGLADRWLISPRTLEQWRWQGRGPRYLKIGGRVVYRLTDI
jgi:hypothetical protein